MTAKLVIENLKHKPMRSLLSFLLIGVPVTLILTLVGLSHGMLEDSHERARGIGADIIVRGTNANSVLNASGATLSEKKFLELFEKWPHVTQAMGVVLHPIEFPLIVNGVDLPRLMAMSGDLHFLSGGPFQQPNDMIVDQYYAAQKKVKVGDTIHITGLGSTPWRISGIIQGGILAHVLVPLPVLQDLDSATGKVSQIYLKVDDPKNTQSVIAALKEKLGSAYPVWSLEEMTSMLSVNNIQGLKAFIYVIMGVGVVIGFAVVCLSMYMSVLQRTREIGILKSLGGSKAFILRIILAEAMILGLGGTTLGVIMSFGAQWLIRTFVPASLPMQIVPIWWLIAGAITLVGAGLGSVYPGLSAARHDPIEALAYE